MTKRCRVVLTSAVDAITRGDLLFDDAYAPVRQLGAVLADSDDQAGGELGWQLSALCAQTDPEAFFPEKGGSTREAKATCSRCEVQAACLSYALANDERFGVWGGLSERERRRTRRNRAAVDWTRVGGWVAAGG